MAESDRPTPDAAPHETPAEQVSDLEQVRFADGTLVGESSQGATSEEMDELLSLFEEELTGDDEVDPTAGMSEQEAAQEDLVRQAEALLGTVDPDELEELAHVHRTEAAEQYARLAQQRGATDPGASAPPTAPEPEPAPPAEAAPAPAPPSAAPAPQPAPAAAETLVDQAVEPEPVAAPRAARGIVSIVGGLVGALFRALTWPVRAVLRAMARVLRLPSLLGGRQVAVGPALQRFATSKGRLATSAGMLAALAAYLGFALFEARFGAAVLGRRYPDAVNRGDVAYYQALGDVEAGRFARARQQLRPLSEDAASPRAGDIQFALGEAYFLDDDAPTNLRFMRARQHYLDAIATDPAHPRVVEARGRIADTYRGQHLWAEAENAYRLLLDRYREAVDAAPTVYALAEVQVEQRRFTDAAEMFERVWNEHPDSALAASARLRQGDALAAAGQLTRAQGLWAQLADAGTAPGVRWEAVWRLAQRAEAQGDVRAAIAWWASWLRNAHDVNRQADVLLRYAHLTHQSGDTPTSLASLDHVLAAYPGHPAAVEAALQRGAGLVAAGETRAARALYADALQGAPEEPRLLVALHDAYQAEGEVDRAVEYAERAAAADPASARAQVTLARAYITAGRPARGMKVYWEMVARYPLAVETQTAVHELTALLQDNGYTAEAYRVVDLYSTVAADAASRAAMHDAKAGLLTSLGLWEDAVQERGAAVAADPTSLRRLHLAEAQLRTRDWRGVLQTAGAIDAGGLTPADRAHVLAMQAEAFVRSDRAPEAAALLAAQVQTFDPVPLRLQALRAEALMAQGATGAARDMMAAFDAATPADRPVPPDLATTYLAWAEHLFAHQIYSRAVEYYARVTGDPFNDHDRAWAAYQVGNCYAQLQDYPRAADAYERMIAAYPRAPWVQFAREKAQFALLQAESAREGSRT